MQGSIMVKNKGMLFPLIIFCACFTGLLLAPMSFFPLELYYIIRDFPYIDDVIHASLFVGMYLLMTMTLTIRKRYIYMAICLLAFGSEGMQMLTLRSASWSDAFADLAGLSMAAIGVLIWEKIK